MTSLDMNNNSIASCGCQAKIFKISEPLNEEVAKLAGYGVPALPPPRSRTADNKFMGIYIAIYLERMIYFSEVYREVILTTKVNQVLFIWELSQNKLIREQKPDR